MEHDDKIPLQTVAQCWRQYKTMCLPAELSIEVECLIRRTFHAGFVSCLAQMVALSDETEEVATDHLENLRIEAAEYAMNVSQRRQGY